MKVVLLESLGISQEALNSLSSPLIESGHEFIAYHVGSEAENRERIKDSDVAIIANMPLRRDLIEAAPNLKMISVAFTGYDHVDMEECRRKNVIVSNCAGYSTASVAELALGLTISVARKVSQCDKAVRSGGTKDGLMGFELAGKTVGIVGTGAIGSRVCRYFQALGCKVLAYSRTERAELKSLGVSYTSLDKLLSSCDVVSLHLPCNEHTVGIIDRDRLSNMKSSALLINTARGPIVDSEALVEALKSGDIGGAGIDVFDVEPPLGSDYPLLSVENCILTPHVAFATPEALEKRAVMAFENVNSWLNNSPINVVG